LYIPGEISNVTTVMVDVGTGYFAEKVGQKLDRIGREYRLPIRKKEILGYIFE